MIQSASNELEDPLIIDTNIQSIALLSTIKMKCSHAILYSNTFEQISDYLEESLSNDKYIWSALVYSTHSTDQYGLIEENGRVYYITMVFGELYVKLYSYLKYLGTSRQNWGF